MPTRAARSWTVGLTEDELHELDNAMSQGDSHKPGVTLKLQHDILDELDRRGLPTRPVGGKTLYLGVLVPGPDYPQPTSPLDVRVFATRDQADAWVSAYYASPSRAENAPKPMVYERQVEPR